MRKLILILAVAALALVPLTVMALSDSAEVEFGRNDLGERPPTVRPDCTDDPIESPGPPECFDSNHDDSAFANDSLYPRTVVISAGGEVLFDNAGGKHRVAVYDAGTEPGDITVNGPGPNVNDGDDRLALGVEAADLTFVFADPGRYLIICNFAPHFTGRNMYGWVIVQ